MGAVLHQAVTLRFKATNNQAEYEALIAGLNFALSMAVKRIQVFSDSLLVVNQVNHAFETKDEVLKKYLQLAKSLISLFEDFSLTHIPREENQMADRLAKGGAHRPPQDSGCWIDRVLDYLKKGVQPDNRREAQKLKLICAKYALIDGELYRRSYAKPLSKCLRPEEALKVMEAIHRGECGTHARGRSLVMRILRQGFFWPNIHKDAQVFVEKCPQCQYYADMQRQPAGYLKPINSSWPFAIWGLDFLRPMPMAMKGYKWILVAVDYFTKWIEAKLLTQPTAQNVENFLWANIVCRYGIPMVIITDNGTPFANQKIHDFCGEHQINLKYASVWHPHTNGQAEAANKNILNILKKCLDDAKTRWPEELPGAIWAYSTAPSEVTRESPFSLSFRMDAVIPIELEHLSPRALQIWVDENDDSRKVDLDLLEQKRELAALKRLERKRRVERYYNRKVNPKTFNQGDLVLKRRLLAGSNLGVPKLEPNWEGPYIVREVTGPNAYHLMTSEGIQIPRSWSGDDLKRFYA
ncbi:hypothetical protein AXF42_Ash021612 [Apostasia shenzhenica]|uniref:Uncharacterized protein n=1 Tax=Apostasia shenzhenica TaxID=1088818 RepID=A0A2H9ZYZ2_9ASPA|nr:hypothetical protein AXF42_Ash021612 [Apostasia shenzhenica]